MADALQPCWCQEGLLASQLLGYHMISCPYNQSYNQLYHSIRPPLHFHAKSLWFEIISIIKVSARLSLDPRQGCYFPCPPKICCTKTIPGSWGLGFEDKHKAEGCPWTCPRISGGHPERKRNPCWCLCAENSYQIKLWLMVGPMDNEHLFCKLSWLFSSMQQICDQLLFLLSSHSKAKVLFRIIIVKITVIFVHNTR